MERRWVAASRFNLIPRPKSTAIPRCGKMRLATKRGVELGRRRIAFRLRIGSGESLRLDTCKKIATQTQYLDGKSAAVNHSEFGRCDAIVRSVPLTYPAAG